MHFIQPQHPRAFLTIYSDVILPISSSTHANNLKAPLDGLPDRILMRYETDRELLYISKQFFTEHHEPRLLKSMQRYQTFKGSRQLRIEKGTGIKSDPQTCYCFDLNAPHVLKEECYGTKEHKHRNLVRSVEVHDTDLRRLATQTFAELNEFMDSLNEQTFKSSVMRNMRQLRRLVEVSFKLHTEAVNMLELRTLRNKYKKDKKSSTPVERVHMPELDEVLKLFMPNLIRKYDVYKLQPDGTVKHKKELILPPGEFDFYTAKNNVSGVYEETSLSDGTRHTKFLWFRLSFLRDMVKQGQLPKNFMDDKRCLVKENKSFLRTTVRCVKLDLRR